MKFFKTFFRYLGKNKLYAFVTVFGFAISLAFVVLITVYIKNELSVDNFQVNKDRIFRMESEESTNFSGPIAVDLKTKYPDIEDYTRVYDGGAVATLKSEEKFDIHFLAVDDSFFKIFSYPLIKGTSKEALSAKNSIVLSEKYANKLFGSTAIVGKQISLNNIEFIISGIVENFPQNTFFKDSDAIINIQAMTKISGWDAFLTEYGFCSLDIFFLQSEGGDLVAKTPEILKNFNKDFWLYKDGYAKDLMFTPLKDVYFSQKGGHWVKSNNKRMIYILSFIVLIILILAIGNYISLTIAQATFRAKEIAIKKLVGSSKQVLFTQLIKESVLLLSLSVLLALFFVKLAEPTFNYLLDTILNINHNISLVNIGALLMSLLIIATISGIIPALKITKFKPIDVVKGTFRKQAKTVYGKVFITFQYTVTIALLACSFIIMKQTKFLKNHDLGFNRQHIIHLPYLSETSKKSTIKNALKQIVGVENVSITWGSPIDGGSNQSFEHNGTSVSFQEFSVDEEFFNVFGINKGTTDIANSKGGVYINEKASKILKVDDKTPTSFKVNENTHTILGVVNDFNFNDLRKNVGPAMLHMQDKESFASNVFVKIDKNNFFETVEKIKGTYAQLVNDAPFKVIFVDDFINNWYAKEEKASKIIGYFTLLSFVISFMGILAMATLYMQQRKKEIGVRKVNGASVLQIYTMLNKNFLKWIALAFVIAIPISWFAMDKWLESFAYKTTQSWWVFALAGLFTFIIAFMSISWQSIRASLTNPVTTLREE